jgi:hypothetical protein
MTEEYQNPPSKQLTNLTGTITAINPGGALDFTIISKPDETYQFVQRHAFSHPNDEECRLGKKVTAIFNYRDET